MNTDPKVQRIIDWRETLNTASDEKFFDIIHIYLGEIKTPYNKQKLIEQLSSFLRNEQNRETIFSLLNDEDIKILTAIKFLNDAEVSKVQKFFVPEFSLGDLYSKLANLEERLLIFTKTTDGKKIIQLNPLLEDDLNPYLSLENLISEESPGLTAVEPALKLSPSVMAVFLSYLSEKKEICKADGSLKKKSAGEISQIFKTDNVQIFQNLYRSFSNLSLINDWDHLEKFSELNFINQIAYLCASFAGHFSRSTIQNNAQLFLQTLYFAKNKFYTKQKIFEISFLIKESKKDEMPLSGRFSRMIAAASSDPLSDSFDNGLFELMTDAAISYGIICPSKENKDVYYIQDIFSVPLVTEKSNLLNLDAGFNVTVMPGLTLKEYLPLIKFLKPLQCDVLSIFEITKQSVIKAFDLGLKKEDIITLLKTYTSFEIPQILLMSLEEWQTSYGSAAIYKGYILKLSAENSFLAEKNPVFAKHIIEILAPGIYLLDFETDEETQNSIAQIGLDFAGTIKNSKEPVLFLPFAKLNSESSFKAEKTESKKLNSIALQKKFLDQLTKEAESLDATSDQKEGLIDRIKRRTVLRSEQLRPESVRFELTEASGMDFTGKIHILEAAIQQSKMIEVELAGKKEKITGYAKGLVKNSPNPLLFMTYKNSNGELEEIEIIIAKISYLKKLRYS